MNLLTFVLLITAVVVVFAVLLLLEFRDQKERKKLKEREREGITTQIIAILDRQIGYSRTFYQETNTFTLYSCLESLVHKAQEKLTMQGVAMLVHDRMNELVKDTPESNQSIDASISTDLILPSQRMKKILELFVLSNIPVWKNEENIFLKAFVDCEHHTRYCVLSTEECIALIVKVLDEQGIVSPTE